MLRNVSKQKIDFILHYHGFIENHGEKIVVPTI